ncbi:hypothetical protein [Massilia sp. 9I]|uniref:hypothetical protein n=1 Tax=Massilia sp. 9I TaxID=2653152 RepID=UPI0012F224DB|nr:hypothetical protein [Massilia sp. 9I]VXB32091.1 hypothetical protein MASSI9I_20461 [Massilia sp. 9I]
MSHLKLVVTNTSRKRKLPPPADTQRAVPTTEFLARKVLALPLGEQTIGATLAELADPLRNENSKFLSRLSDLQNRLILVGIWSMHPDLDDPMPVHGMVVYPAKLVKRYPELKRVLDQLDGLILLPPAA